MEALGLSATDLGLLALAFGGVELGLSGSHTGKGPYGLMGALFVDVLIIITGLFLGLH